MAQIIVTPETLRTKASELRSQNAQLKQQIETLKSYASTLDSQWEGDAHDKFKTEFNKDSVQMTNFYNAIEQYCTKLEEIASKYKSTEATNTSVIHSH